MILCISYIEPLRR